MKYYDKLIFELSKSGRTGYSLPENNYGRCVCELPENLRRAQAPALPEVSEIDVVRHYTNLSQMNFGVDTSTGHRPHYRESTKSFGRIIWRIQ